MKLFFTNNFRHNLERRPERVPKISGGRHPQAGERKRLCKKKYCQSPINFLAAKFFFFFFNKTHVDYDLKVLNDYCVDSLPHLPVPNAEKVYSRFLKAPRFESGKIIGSHRHGLLKLNSRLMVWCSCKQKVEATATNFHFSLGPYDFGTAIGSFSTHQRLRIGIFRAVHDYT